MTEISSFADANIIARTAYGENRRAKRPKAVDAEERRSRDNERAAKYRANNRQKINSARRKKYPKTKELEAARHKIWLDRNPEKTKEYSIKYKDKNRERRIKNRDKENARSRERRKTDIGYRIKVILRWQVYAAIKRYGADKPRFIDVLGCSVGEFLKHLEGQFREGMMWGNYGEWHIDHRIPCASFDLTKKEAQDECFNYKNLQPLWASENFRKNSKLNWQIEKTA